jgi:hypothetical protein
MWGKCPACEAKDAENARLVAERDKLLAMVEKFAEQGIMPKREVRASSQALDNQHVPMTKSAVLGDGLPRFRGLQKAPIWGKDLALFGHMKPPVPVEEVAQIDE